MDPTEFMEGLKKIFQEAESSAALNIHFECPTKDFLSCVQNYLKRCPKPCAYPLPPIESVLETLAYSVGLQPLFEKKTIIVAEDVIPLINDRISYKQFCQAFCPC